MDAGPDATVASRHTESDSDNTISKSNSSDTDDDSDRPNTESDDVESADDVESSDVDDETSPTSDDDSPCPESAPAQRSRCEVRDLACEYDSEVCVCTQGGGNRTWLCSQEEASESEGQDAVILLSPADENTRVATSPTLSATVYDADDDAVDVTFFARQKDPEPWSLIVLPDTQYLSESFPNIYTTQTQWIVDEKESFNIQMVIHEGDFVNVWNDTTQWDRANTSMSLIIDARIPLTFAPGDRDHEGQEPQGDTQFYSDTFPASRFRNNPWWGGSYNQNTNNYATLNIGGDDYLFMAVDFCPLDDEILWASEVLDDHPNHKVIFSTHALINEDGAYSDAYDITGGDCGDTSFIWEDLIRTYDNIQLVLCGHMHLDDGEKHQVVNNPNGIPVHQVLANYQMRMNGGDGLLRIMTFLPTQDQITVETYSPNTDAYETDADSQFNLSYEMNAFREIGKVEGVKSGDEAEVRWQDLQTQTTYEWYVEVTHGDENTTTSDTWTYTTGR